MDSSLQKSQIESHLQCSSSDNDSDEETDTGSYKSPRKGNENRSQYKKQEGVQSRKRKADCVEESKPAKIGRNTPSKNKSENVCGLPVSFSPGERSSPRNTRRQIFGSSNKMGLSESPVKLSAKKNLFASETQQNKACVIETNGSTESVPKDEDQFSSDDLVYSFKIATKSNKGRFLKTHSKLKESYSEYSVKSPSKTSPLKVRLVKDSPLRKTKTNVNSPAKYGNNPASISKKQHLPGKNKEVTSESDSEQSERGQTCTPRRSHSTGKTIKLRQSIELKQLNTDMNDKRMITPKEKDVEDSENEQLCQNDISFAVEDDKTSSLDNKTSPKKPLSKTIKKVASESDSEQSDNNEIRIPKKNYDYKSNKNKLGESTYIIKRLNTDMNECVTSPRTSKRMITPKEKDVEDSKNEQLCQNDISFTVEDDKTSSLDNKTSPKTPLSKTIKKVASESDSEQSDNDETRIPRKNYDYKIKKNKLRESLCIKRLNIDMNECVTSPRTSKRMITPRKSNFKDSTDNQVTSSEKPVKQKSSSKDRKVSSEGKELVKEKVKLILDSVKADLNKGATTPRKTRRSSVTFSPLPPKHRCARTPRKDYYELSEEDSPVKKSSSKTPHRRSLKDVKENIPENFDYVTPTKRKGTRSGRSCSSISKDDEEVENKEQCSTPLQRRSLSVTTPVSKKGTGRGFLTPSMARKETSSQTRTEDELDAMRRQLHISTVPKSLPCRDNEFSQIKSFLARKIEHLSGGCMYISGVPGTGKTATVHAVVRSLQEDVDNGDLTEFDFVEVNGLRLTEPKQAYVRIYQALTDKKLTPDQAQQLLSRKFSGNCKKSTIILVDELDYLCNRRQDVVYNILDWPTKRNSALVVLTISNTMDLAERTLKGRVTSRMGLTRVTFQPYSHHQLQEIVLDRLCGSEAFHPDAVQLVARKVAAVSGDARRALDICRRTTELVSIGEQVTAGHVQQALIQIFSGPRVLVIQQLSGLSQLVLRSLRDVSHATGIEESTVAQLYKHLEQISVLENLPLPTVGTVLQTCVSLVNLGLIVAEKGRHDINRKLSLNVSSDDIHYALDNVRSL